MTNQVRYILHIANDFLGSKVYYNLFSALDRNNLSQVVYTTVRTPRQEVEDTERISIGDSLIILDHNWKWYYRLLYHRKIRSLTNSLLQEIGGRIEEVGLIHAHTLFSDGAIALHLYRKYGIPYVVTVRNTDMNLFAKYMPHTWPTGGEVLNHAQKVITISESYKKRILERFDPNGRKGLVSKLFAIPNGIDPYWIANIETRRHDFNSSQPFRLLYIGTFDSGKNVMRLLKAVERVNAMHFPTNVTLVGGGSRERFFSQEKEVLSYVEGHPFVDYLGPIYDKERLVQIMRSHHAFAMPSINETFGLVYVESWSQGLPILYSLGEGIDGYCMPKEGVACNPLSVDSIEKAILEIREKYEEFNLDPDRISRDFDWDNVASRYIDLIYNDFLL